MAHKAEIKTTFEPFRTIQPIYTGGDVALDEDGRVLATCLGEEALLTRLDTGEHLVRIEGDDESITTLALAPDASYLTICSRSLSMRVYALRSSEAGIEAVLMRTLKPHTTPVVVSAIDSSSSLLATAGADAVIKVWDLRHGHLTHTFHGHSGVITALHFFTVDLKPAEKTSTATKKRLQAESLQNGETEATAGYRLASGGEDGKIRVWDLHKRRSIATLDAHASVVRSLDYSNELGMLLSGSRDKTAIVWDAQSWQMRTTVPVLEGVESAGFLSGSLYFFTGGESSRLRLWHCSSGAEATVEQTSGTETDAIVQILYFPRLPWLLTVHADQTLLLHSLSPLQHSLTSQLQPLPILRRISGTHDEVIDLAYIGPDRNMLALATNLEDIRIVSLDSSDGSILDTTVDGSSPYFGSDVALLKGHEDIVITIDTDWSGHWLVTGAKDNTAKLWRLDVAQGSYTCYTTFTGHAESIGAVALPSSSPQVGSKEHEQPLAFPPKFLITGSQDKTIKRWDISSTNGKAPKAAYTRKAHDKDINAVATSHSTTAPLFASASQDRTVKIWDVDTGEAIGVLRGHKRGVWSVAFSPVGMQALTTNESGGASSNKGMLVTGSGDKTVRIWNLSDFSCLRTFEGHANSVLKVVWLPASSRQGNGRSSSKQVRVASAAGDGLVKVWDAQSGECAATLDNHIDRVWALAVKPEPILPFQQPAKQGTGDTDIGDDDGEITPAESSLELVSGSADSSLTFWHDTTAITTLQATTQATARIEQDQQLQNHIRSSNYREAVVLALQLNHPKRLLDLFTSVVNSPQHDPRSFTGRTEVDTVLAELGDTHLWTLLLRLRDWNANGRTHNVAQHILNAVLHLHPKERILGLRRRRSNKANVVVNDDLAAAMADLSTKDERRKESVKDVLDGLKVYTERHFARVEKTGDERFVLAWVVQSMDDVGGISGGGVDSSVLSLDRHGGGEMRAGEDLVMLNGPN